MATMKHLFLVIAVIAAITKTVNCEESDALEELHRLMLELHSEVHGKIPLLSEQINEHEQVSEVFSAASALQAFQNELDNTNGDSLGIEDTRTFNGMNKAGRKLAKAYRTLDKFVQASEALPGALELLQSLEVDVCRNNPCQNEGVCIAQGSNRYCHCVGGYYGEYCEQESSRLVIRENSDTVIYNLADGSSDAITEPSSVDSEGCRCRLSSSEYIVSGRSAPFSAEVFIINADTGDETALPDLPQGRSLLSCLVVEGFVYMVGGYGNSKLVHRLNLQSPEEWEALPELESGAAWPILLSNRTHLFVMGGVQNRNVQVYDLSSLTLATYDELSQTFDDDFNGAVLYDPSTILLFTSRSVTVYDIEAMQEGDTINHFATVVYAPMQVVQYQGDILLILNNFNFYQIVRYDHLNTNTQIIDNLSINGDAGRIEAI